MLSWLFGLVLDLRKALKANDSPRRLAVALALGMLLGLVPKGNLIFVAMSFVVLSIRLNVGVIALTALVFSLLAATLDLVTHRIGAALLYSPRLADFWTDLYDRPLMPWTRFNNTVVLGNLVLGLALFYPVYHIAARFLEWRRDRRLAANEQGTDDAIAQEHDVVVSETTVTGQRIEDDDADNSDWGTLCAEPTGTAASTDGNAADVDPDEPLAKSSAAA